MKFIKNTFIILTILSLSLYAGCKGNDPTTETTPLTEQLDLLLNGGSSWVVFSVIKDGYEVTNQFSGFTLFFDNTSYSTTNSIATAWASTGTWAFHNNNPEVIMRDDGTLISVSLANNELVLSFSVTGLPTGGRTEGVDGDYVFTLVSQ